MREHQIVITLKPDQFLQVQKMARGAGAKSMGMFVRQTLLQALGLEAGLEPRSEKDRKIEPALMELKRLQREVQDFVAESLYQFNEVVQADLVHAEKSELMEAGESELAPLPEKMAGLAAYETASDPEPLAIAESAQAAAFQSDTAGSAAIFKNDLDELEETAARVFAISPRLGTSAAENAKTKRDPLADLLEDDEKIQDKSADQIQSSSASFSEEDDDSYDVPLSILSRRRELAQQGRLPDLKEEEEKNKAARNSDSGSASHKPPAKIDKRELNKNSAGSQEENLGPKEEESGSVSGNYPKYEPLDNRDDDTPFSGGPPPKRRQ